VAATPPNASRGGSGLSQSGLFGPKCAQRSVNAAGPGAGGRAQPSLGDRGKTACPRAGT